MTAMKLTSDVRKKARIDTVKFLGDLDSGAGLEAAITMLDTSKTDLWKTDRVVAAMGSNPMAPTGILSFLGPLYQDLQPVHRGHGFFACDSDASIIVTSTPLSFDQQKFGADFQSVLKNMPDEVRVPGGILAARLSATAVADFIAEESPKDK